MLIFFAMIVVASRAKGQCPVRSDRPLEDLFQSDAVYPQSRGEAQVELIPRLETDRDGQSASVGVATQYGLTSTWGLNASWDGPVRSGTGTARTWSVGDLSVGSKLAFTCVGRSAYQASVSVDLELPTGTLDGDRRTRIAPNVIVGRDIPAISAHVFTGVVLSMPVGHAASGAGGADIAGTTGEWDFGGFLKSHAFRVTAEFTVSSDFGGQDDVQVTTGLIWHSEPWEIGVGAPIALNRGAPHGLLVHLVYSFGGARDER